MNALSSFREDSMRVLQLSTYDGRGAGRAAHRLNQGLQSIGVESQMLVQSKSSDDSSVLAPQSKVEKVTARLRPSLSRLPLSFYAQREPTDFYPSWLPDRLHPRIQALNPAVINLHWLCDGFLEMQSLSKFRRPLVWTIHDMWAFTGGCHYSQGCTRYIDSCGACPQLASSVARDLSRWQWHRKVDAVKDLNLTVVSPSQWLAQCAQSSSIFSNVRVEVIPNGVDVARYQPSDRAILRALLHLPQDKFLVSFGAMQATQNKRKGFSLLQTALHELRQTPWQNQIELVIFGSSQPKNAVDLGFKTHYLGRLHDDISLALVYAAADVFVAPSLEDNLPNTVVEAMACGTPCVAFRIGGMPDLIDHHHNGYLAQPYQVEDFAQGIRWVLENRDRHQKLGQGARQKVEAEFTLQIQANRYLDLYQDIVR